MSYQPSTDFIGLWRHVIGGVEKATMPGLDWWVAAMGRAGLINLHVSAMPPITNQETTAWFLPASPSYSAEGALYLWDKEVGSYRPATPELFREYVGGGGEFSKDVFNAVFGTGNAGDVFTWTSTGPQWEPLPSVGGFPQPYRKNTVLVTDINSNLDWAWTVGDDPPGTRYFSGILVRSVVENGTQHRPYWWWSSPGDIPCMDIKNNATNPIQSIHPAYNGQVLVSRTHGDPNKSYTPGFVHINHAPPNKWRPGTFALFVVVNGTWEPVETWEGNPNASNLMKVPGSALRALSFRINGDGTVTAKTASAPPPENWINVSGQTLTVGDVGYFFTHITNDSNVGST